MKSLTFLIGSLIAATLATAAVAQTPTQPVVPAAIPATTPAPPPVAAPVPAGPTALYGQIGRMTAIPGKRDDLITILLTGTKAMPGCLSYVVAKDVDDADAVWVSEVWDSVQSHDASFDLPAVQDAMTRGRPLIAKVDTGIVTMPMGGVGLPR